MTSLSSNLILIPPMEVGHEPSQTLYHKFCSTLTLTLTNPHKPSQALTNFSSALSPFPLIAAKRSIPSNCCKQVQEDLTNTQIQADLRLTSVNRFYEPHEIRRDCDIGFVL